MPRKTKPQETPAADEQPPRHAGPMRLLPYDWPFLYSVMENGDLVMNKRLPKPKPSVRRRREESEDEDEAPF